MLSFSKANQLKRDQFVPKASFLNMSINELRIGSCPNPKYNWTNRAYVSKEVFESFKKTFVLGGGKLVDSDPHLNLNVGTWVFTVW